MIIYMVVDNGRRPTRGFGSDRRLAAFDPGSPVDVPAHGLGVADMHTHRAATGLAGAERAHAAGLMPGCAARHAAD